MIPSNLYIPAVGDPVYQRGWMIDSQLEIPGKGTFFSISKGMDD